MKLVFSKKNILFIWWLLMPFLISYLVFCIVWAILFFLNGSNDLASNIIETFSQVNFPYIAAIMHLLLFIFAYSKMNKECSFWLIKKFDVIWSILVAFLAIVIIVIILNVLDLFNISLDINYANRNQLLLIAFVTSITAGFGEELYFRAFLFNVSNNYSKWFVILSTSMSFAIWHPNWKWFLHTFLVGVLFGWFYTKKKRILPVIIAHIITDMSLGLLAYMSLS